MNLYICKTREIWQCNWCKVSKYNYDMIQMNFGKIQMCSLNCLSLHEVSLNALTPKRSKCAHCKLLKQPQYHLTMSDASIRNFCTYQCAIGFQGMFSKSKMSDDDPSAVVPAGTAKRIKPSSVACKFILYYFLTGAYFTIFQNFSGKSQTTSISSNNFTRSVVEFETRTSAI